MLSLRSGFVALTLAVPRAARLKAGHTQEALPNPSFKRSPNGVALGPRGSAVCVFHAIPDTVPL